MVETSVEVRTIDSSHEAHGPWLFKTLSIVQIGDWKRDRDTSQKRNANRYCRSGQVVPYRCPNASQLESCSIACGADEDIGACSCAAVADYLGDIGSVRTEAPPPKRRRKTLALFVSLDEREREMIASKT